MKKTGFTLVELLVVVAIIAILAAVGVVVFTNIQKGSRDARRKADINAIASAYESKFNSVTGQYSVLTASNFQSGKMPAPPENPIGSYRFIAGPNSNSLNSSLYKVCAILEGAESLYCRFSSQGSAAAAAAGSCPNFRMPTAGGGTRDGISGGSQECRGYLSTYVTVGGVNTYNPNIDLDGDNESEVWVRCNDVGRLECATATCGNTGNIDWYDSFTDAVADKKQSPQVWIYNRSCEDWRPLTTVYLY